MADVLENIAGGVEVPDEDHAVVGAGGELLAEWSGGYHCGWKAMALISSLWPLKVRSSLGSYCYLIMD